MSNECLSRFLYDSVHLKHEVRVTYYENIIETCWGEPDFALH